MKNRKCRFSTILPVQLLFKHLYPLITDYKSPNNLMLCGTGFRMIFCRFACTAEKRDINLLVSLFSCQLHANATCNVAGGLWKQHSNIKWDIGKITTSYYIIISDQEEVLNNRYGKPVNTFIQTLTCSPTHLPITRALYHSLSSKRATQDCPSTGQ